MGQRGNRWTPRSGPGRGGVRGKEGDAGDLSLATGQGAPHFWLDMGLGRRSSLAITGRA